MPHHRPVVARAAARSGACGCTASPRRTRRCTTARSARDGGSTAATSSSGAGSRCSARACRHAVRHRRPDRQADPGRRRDASGWSASRRRLGNNQANDGGTRTRREMNGVLVPLETFRAYLRGGERIGLLMIKTPETETPRRRAGPRRSGWCAAPTTASATSRSRTSPTRSSRPRAQIRDDAAQLDDRPRVDRRHLAARRRGRHLLGAQDLARRAAVRDRPAQGDRRRPTGRSCSSSSSSRRRSRRSAARSGAGSAVVVCAVSSRGRSRPGCRWRRSDSCSASASPSPSGCSPGCSRRSPPPASPRSRRCAADPAFGRMP